MTDEPEFRHHMHTVFTFPSAADIEGFGVPELFAAMIRTQTPEEAKANDERRKVEKAERDSLQADVLAIIGSGPLYRIVDLHSPDEFGYCQGCGGDEWPSGWPCATWRIAAGEDA